MSSLKSYIQDVMSDTSPLFKRHRRYIKELIVTVLAEGVYVDYVWFSVSHSKKIEIAAKGYDENSIDVEVTGTWERDMSLAPGDLHLRHFKLVDVLVEEL